MNTITVKAIMKSATRDRRSWRGKRTGLEVANAVGAGLSPGGDGAAFSGSNISVTFATRWGMPNLDAKVPDVHLYKVVAKISQTPE